MADKSLEQELGIGGNQGVRVSVEDKESLAQAIDLILSIAQRKIKDPTTVKYVSFLLFTIRGILSI